MRTFKKPYKRFEVGQVVRIRTRKEVDEFYGCIGQVPYSLNSSMRKMLGMTVTVLDICARNSFSDGWAGYIVKIKEDRDLWTWHSGMFIAEDNVTDKVCEVLRG